MSGSDSGTSSQPSVATPDVGQPTAPVDQTATPCSGFDCAAAWKECEAQADAIINKSNDPIQRNKYISAAYAKLYMQNPKLEWLGAGAFASKQVGCGLRAAKDAIDMAEADRGPWNMDRPNPIVQIQGGYAKTVYDALAKGNKNLFKDIYPSNLFYQKYGGDKLKQCANARQPPVDDLVVRGFSDIDAGHPDAGALKIAQHEQLHVLQSPDVFGNPNVVSVMKLNQSMSQHWYGRALGAQPTSVSFTANCTGDPSVTFQGTNPADPNERWPYAQKVVGTFDSLKNTPQITQGLQGIVQQGQ